MELNIMFCLLEQGSYTVHLYVHFYLLHGW